VQEGGGGRVQISLVNTGYLDGVVPGGLMQFEHGREMCEVVENRNEKEKNSAENNIISRSCPR
jgi:hypothetical protein